MVQINGVVLQKYSICLKKKTNKTKTIQQHIMIGQRCWWIFDGEVKPRVCVRNQIQNQWQSKMWKKNYWSPS